MSKLIAIPRRPVSGSGALAYAAGAGFARHDRLYRTTETAADDSLLSLGLHAAPTAPVEPVPKNSYKRLENLGAYIIDPPSRAASEKVKEELESDFIVVPNITLSVPEPVAGKAKMGLGRKGQSWPEESGIARAHRNGVRGRGVLVGVLDTGCDVDHREIRRKRVEFRYFPFSSSTALRTWRPRTYPGSQPSTPPVPPPLCGEQA